MLRERTLARAFFVRLFGIGSDLQAGRNAPGTLPGQADRMPAGNNERNIIMHRPLKRVAVIIALCLGMAGLAEAAEVFVRISPPPPLNAQIVGVAPGPRHVWIPGYQSWNGRAYVWVPGRWIVPPRAGVVWIPPRWVPRRGGYVFVPGYWR